jgi:hypothetical protein
MMTSSLFSAALAVSGCISAFCHRQFRTSLGRDVSENDPRHCCRASILRKQKKARATK